MDSQELYDKYYDLFDDYPPTMEMRGLSGEEMDKKIEEAIANEKPIEVDQEMNIDY